MIHFQCHAVLFKKEEGGNRRGLLRVDAHGQLCLWQLPTPPPPCLPRQGKPTLDGECGDSRSLDLADRRQNECDGEGAAQHATDAPSRLAGKKQRIDGEGGRTMLDVLASGAERALVREQARLRRCFFDLGGFGLVRASDVSARMLRSLCDNLVCAKCAGDVKMDAYGITMCRVCAASPLEAAAPLFRPCWPPVHVLLECRSGVALDASASNHAVTGLFSGIEVRGGVRGGEWGWRDGEAAE